MALPRHLCCECTQDTPFIGTQQDLSRYKYTPICCSTNAGEVAITGVVRGALRTKGCRTPSESFVYNLFSIKREADTAKRLTLCTVPKYTEVRIVVDKLNNSCPLLQQQRRPNLGRSRVTWHLNWTSWGLKVVRNGPGLSIVSIQNKTIAYANTGDTRCVKLPSGGPLLR